MSEQPPYKKRKIENEIVNKTYNTLQEYNDKVERLLVSDYNKDGRIRGKNCHYGLCNKVVNHKVYCNIINNDVAVCNYHFLKFKLKNSI